MNQDVTYEDVQLAKRILQNNIPHDKLKQPNELENLSCEILLNRLYEIALILYSRVGQDESNYNLYCIQYAAKELIDDNKTNAEGIPASGSNQSQDDATASKDHPKLKAMFQNPTRQNGHGRLADTSQTDDGDTEEIYPQH